MTKTSLRTNDIVKMVNLNSLQKNHIGTNDIVKTKKNGQICRWIGTNDIVNNVVEVKNLFSLSGLKHIFTTAVSSFVNFEPLPLLIIVLIGIGVMEKSGFLEAFFTILIIASVSH